MGELHSLGEKRAEKFRNMSEAEVRESLHREFLAESIVLRESQLELGSLTEEQVDEWSKQYIEEIDAMPPQDREAILGRAEQIKAERQRQQEIIEKHGQGAIDDSGNEPDPAA